MRQCDIGCVGSLRGICNRILNIEAPYGGGRRARGIPVLEQPRISVSEPADEIDEAVKAAFRAGFAITVHEDGPFSRIIVVGTDLDLEFRGLLVADTFGTEPFEGITHLWAVLATAHADLLH